MRRLEELIGSRPLVFVLGAAFGSLVFVLVSVAWQVWYLRH